MQGLTEGRLAYFAFDLPWCGGYDLTRTPLLDRKALLKQLLQLSGEDSQIFYADHIQGQGGTVFHNACRFSLEGIVSKQPDSAYEQKRSRRWVKVKCFKRQEFVIGGFTDPGGAREGFGALLLGYDDPGGDSIYSGRVGTGFDDRTLKRLSERLTPMQVGKSPFANPPTGREAKGVHYIRPELAGEVEFADWTEEGILRRPSFKGLREDKDPAEIVRGRLSAKTCAPSRSSRPGAPESCGPKISPTPIVCSTRKSESPKKRWLNIMQISPIGSCLTSRGARLPWCAALKGGQKSASSRNTLAILPRGP